MASTIVTSVMTHSSAAFNRASVELSHWWDKAKAHPMVAAGVGVAGVVVAKVASDAHKKHWR